MLEIGALRQGIYESVSSFWAKIQKYGDQLGYTPAQKKTHFLSGVRPDIRDEIYRIGQTKPINDIIDTIEKIRDAHTKQIPNRKRIIYANYKIGSERYDNIVNSRIYPRPPEIEITSMNSSISIPQSEILPIHSLSSARNPEQVISLSKPATKKTSRKSESKTINHSISSIPGSDVQARMENLREYKKQFQAES
ncbi:8261_t:CDS:2 [Racocetra persica]|uniref:8261_t:CDS:1 n=1 Tax=Racocetra persica TaxID=160502 RepID=A0ACA9P7E5_9GLOM|nr:8261_t:CDS:2 [Racocetra persica]